MFRRILVATHGTEGAVRAEQCAVELAKAVGAELYGLYVINRDWGSLAGIEWLHPSATRMEFYRHAESELNRRAREVLKAFEQRAKEVPATAGVRIGEPTEEIVEVAKANRVDLIIVGGGSRRRSEEYKAKISLKKLMRRAHCPVLIATIHQQSLEREVRPDELKSKLRNTE